jgi:hypothetical protein
MCDANSTLKKQRTRYPFDQRILHGQDLFEKEKKAVTARRERQAEEI